jgi:hypothetical protein
LVEIVAYTEVAPEVQAATPTLQLPTPTPAPQAPQAPPGPQVGYVEDIQPMFERSCSACHSAAARTMGLQTTAFRPLMEGSLNGPVVVPGDPEASKLWQMVGTGKMPLTGALPLEQQQIVYEWIKEGAAERRAPKPVPQAVAALPQATAVTTAPSTWLTLGPDAELEAVPDGCPPDDDLATLVSSDLILPVSCGAIPNDADLAALLGKVGLQPAVGGTPAAVASGASPGAAQSSGISATAVISEAAPVAAAPAVPRAGARRPSGCRSLPRKTPT